MIPSLDDLLADARNRVQTASEKEEQRRSFAYGNLKLSNPNVTREDIDRAAEQLANLRERGEHE